MLLVGLNGFADGSRGSRCATVEGISSCGLRIDRPGAAASLALPSPRPVLIMPMTEESNNTPDSRSCAIATPIAHLIARLPSLFSPRARPEDCRWDNTQQYGCQ